MENNKHSFDSLVNDETFIAWVKTGSHSPKWNAFMEDYPEDHHLIADAREFIISLESLRINDDEIQMRDKIWENVSQSVIKPESTLNFKIIVSIAVFFLLLLLGILHWKSSTNPEKESLIVSNEKWIEYNNSSNENWPIDLVDGSQVILEPNAYLKYPSVFNQKSRRVQLKGDAFFDIAHDTLKPFYVHANEAVIRVLGTSFFVKAEEEDNDVRVIVKTGKVAVYKGKEVKEYQARKIKTLKPILVTPNQVATLNKSNLVISKRLVPRPTLTKSLSSIDRIYFENKSIHEIAAALSSAYGVDIEISASISETCRLTTTLTDQPLFEKLKIICDPLGLKFLEKDVKIHIIGNCK